MNADALASAAAASPRPPTPAKRRVFAGAPPQIRRAAAVVNEAGGGVEAGAADALRAILDRFSIEADVKSVAPQDMPAAVKEAASRAPDLLVTLAGDGTARYAAGLCGADGPLVAPLAGGTMNMLPYALYGRAPWREALEAALSNGVVRPVPGGTVNGSPFYVAAILGSPALWGPAREALRRGQPLKALARARRALAHSFKRRLRYRLDGGARQKAEALALVSPLMTDACFDGSALEAVALDPRHAADVFRIGAASLFGDWRADPAVLSQCCRTAEITATQSIPCMLDGEAHRIADTAEIGFVPHAFYALVGADAPSVAAVPETRGS
ncbi:diacylglycerol/lipid kinase family protein [Methylocella sp.]|uniref:diacylglycerol/lipid kinase family protein n=1 Tax=Methylocella sp. TaxID=1978226 RepID=UPI0037834EBB